MNTAEVTADSMTKTVKLVRGPGFDGGSACWVSALNIMLYGKHSDKLECADESWQKLCHCINDYCEDDHRHELVFGSGMFFDIVGTKTDDPAENLRRLFQIIDTAIRVWTPDYLMIRGCATPSGALRQLPPITDQATIANARKVIEEEFKYMSSYASYDDIKSLHEYQASGHVITPIGAVANTLNITRHIEGTFSTVSTHDLYKMAISCSTFTFMHNTKNGTHFEYLRDSVLPHLSKWIKESGCIPVEAVYCDLRTVSQRCGGKLHKEGVCV